MHCQLVKLCIMEKNKKLTEVPIANSFSDGYALAVIGGSLKRVPRSLLPESSEVTSDSGQIFVMATPPSSGYSYVINDDRITLTEGEDFFCIFADDSAPTRSNISLNINGIECLLYWKGENISIMAQTFGEVFTSTNGYVHLIYRNGHLELIGVDTISSSGRIYYSPNNYIESNHWYDA